MGASHAEAGEGSDWRAPRAWPPFSERLLRQIARAREVTCRVAGDDKIPWCEPDGRTPFLDTFELHPDWPYPRCLAAAIVASWEASPCATDVDESLVGVPRPPRPLFEHFSWGIRADFAVLDAPAYRDGKEAFHRRFRDQQARLEPLGWSVIEEEAIRRLGSREVWQATQGSLWSVAGYQGHTVPDYGKLLTLGIGGVLAGIRRSGDRHADPQAVELLRACETIYEGLSQHLGRYAAHAEMVGRPEVAETCRAVMLSPPQTLHHAAQLLWSYALWDDVDSMGRIDQYLYPFYQRDVATGVLSKESAFEIVAELWVHLMRWSAHTLTLGGQTPAGADATNDLTWMCLEISRRLHDTHPRITVRLHADSPPDLLLFGVGMWAEGMADPTFVSDMCVIPALCDHEVALTDARNYAVMACQEIEVPGKSNTGCEDGALNLAKCMELALNDGVCRITGQQLGPRTGDPRTFATFDDVWRAYATQVEILTEHFVALCNLGVGLRSANLAKLVRMPLTGDCLERGLDPDGGGAVYGPGEAETMGIAAAADQLTAIRRLVFTEGCLTMPELADVLATGFAGREDLRLLLLRRAPKFGNDDPEADGMARRVAEHFWTVVGSYRNPRGGRYFGATALLDKGTTWGRNVAAGADGKRAGEPLGNTCGPRTGVDTSGLTAMLLSVAQLPFHLAPGGVPCNIRVPPRSLQTAEGRMKIAGLVQGYFAAGGQMVQATTIDSATLRDAEAHPERHGDLIVRVGGYSARFVMLSRGIQDEITAWGESL